MRVPATGTAMPSATVVPPDARSRPVVAASIDGHRSLCTPTTTTSGRRALAATAIPATSPPPPTGTTSASRSGWSASSSRATVPCPAMTAGSSYGCTSTRPSSAAMRRASCGGPGRSAPCSTTRAPSTSVRCTFTNGVAAGITIVASMPRRVACRATAWAWLPADIATTPRARSSSVSEQQLVARSPLLERRGELQVLELQHDVDARAPRSGSATGRSACAPPPRRSARRRPRRRRG